jgi:hypothetical protein
MPAETLSSRLTRALGRWLSRWGVDAEQYHWLLQASIRMDLRSRSAIQVGHHPHSAKSALIIMGVMYGLFSLFLAIALRAADVGTFLFTSVMFGYSMTMMAMSILIEFGMVVISPDDFLILAHRPVSSRTFFAVKCSNLLFYTLLIDLSLNVAPCVVGWTFRDAPWHFPLSYSLVAALAGVFVAGAVAALYGFLLQRINYERFKDFLTWCQVLVSFLVFFGYQMIPRLIGRMEGIRLVAKPSAAWLLLPPVWFAGLGELALGHFSWFVAALGSLALVVMLLLLPGLLRSVSLEYSDRIGGLVAAAVKRGSARNRPNRASASWLERVSTFDPEERALFGFLLKMLRRNRRLKLQLYPNFGIVVALFAVGVLDHKNLTDPLVSQGGGHAMLIPLMGFMFGAMGLTAALPYSDEYQGGWIFHAAPILRPEKFLTAIKKAVFLLLLLPLFILNLALFSLLWPPWHALEISLYGLAMGLVMVQIALLSFREFPLARKPEKAAQSSRLALAMILTVPIGIFMALPGLFASHPASLPIIVTLLLAATLALGAFNNRAYAGAIRRLEEPRD